MALSIGFALTLHGATLLGAVDEYTNKSEWITAAGAYTTLGFTEFPEYTELTDQYAELGAVFTDGFDFVVYDPGFLNDGFGLYGAIDSITVEFENPMSTIAVDFPGAVQFQLFVNNSMIYESTIASGGFLGNFFGIISDTPFDKAIILDPTLAVYIDDLHFGPPIPAPPVGVLSLWAFTATRSRRRSARWMSSQASP